MRVAGLRDEPLAQIQSLCQRAKCCAPPSTRPQRAFFSDDERSWIRTNYRLRPVGESVVRYRARFGRQVQAISLNAVATRWKLGTPPLLTDEQLAWMRAHVGTKPLHAVRADFELRFGWPLSSSTTQKIVRVYGLYGTPNTGCFDKGHVPFNKGMKGWSAPGTEATRFRKGNTPPNRVPLWSERWTTNKAKKPIREIKVPERNPYTGFPTRWVRKAVWAWQQANGPVPEKHAIVLLDGDEENCELDNLVCVHRRVLQRLNARWADKSGGTLTLPIRLRIAQIEEEIARHKRTP